MSFNIRATLIFFPLFFIFTANDQIKVKKEDGQPQINYGSAFLGGNLWDKPCGDMDFNLQYMDLDEFLSENNIEEPVPTTDAQPTHVQSEESLAPSNSGKF